MQAVAKSCQRVVAAKPAARSVAPRSALRVVCKANKHVQAFKAAVTSLPILIASHPAYALVDDRMNGDGTGKAFGVNDGAVGWAIVLTFGTMWALFFTSQKDLGSEDGLDL